MGKNKRVKTELLTNCPCTIIGAGANTKATVTGKRGPLRGTMQAKQVSTHNKYLLLIEDTDEDDVDDVTDDEATVPRRNGMTYNPNRRQRRKNKLQLQHDEQDTSTFEKDDAIRDAAAKGVHIEVDWLALDRGQSHRFARRTRVARVSTCKDGIRDLSIQEV